MRPTPIVRFEQLALLSVLFGAVMVVLTWEQSVAMAQTIGMGAGFILSSQFVFYALFLGLVLLVSRRGSRIVKWLLTALTGFALIWLIVNLGTLVGQGAAGIVQIAQIVVMAVAVAFLFSAEAQPWFRREAPAEEPPVD